MTSQRWQRRPGSRGTWNLEQFVRSYFRSVLLRLIQDISDGRRMARRLGPFYTALGPLLGKLMPAANAKRCTVVLDGVEVLSKGFKL